MEAARPPSNIMPALTHLHDVLNELAQHVTQFSPDDQIRLMLAMSEYTSLCFAVANMEHILRHIDGDVLVAAAEAAQQCAQREEQEAKARLN